MSGDTGAESDPRVISDITPDNGWRPGARYAQSGSPPRPPPSAPSPPPRNPTQDQRWLAQEQGHVVEGADWFSEYEPSVQAYLDSPNTLQELQQAVSAPKPGYDIHHIVEKTSAEQDGFPKLMINGSENLVRIPRFKHREITGGLYDEE